MEVATVFLETSLGTRLAVSFPASATTVADLKRSVSDEHAAAFPHIGHIAVQAIKVKQGGSLYLLTDSMAVRDAFRGVTGAWHLQLQVHALPRPRPALHQQMPQVPHGCNCKCSSQPCVPACHQLECEEGSPTSRSFAANLGCRKRSACEMLTHQQAQLEATHTESESERAPPPREKHRAPAADSDSDFDFGLLSVHNEPCSSIAGNMCNAANSKQDAPCVEELNHVGDPCSEMQLEEKEVDSSSQQEAMQHNVEQKEPLTATLLCGGETRSNGTHLPPPCAADPTKEGDSSEEEAIKHKVEEKVCNSESSSNWTDPSPGDESMNEDDSSENEVMQHEAEEKEPWTDSVCKGGGSSHWNDPIEWTDAEQRAWEMALKKRRRPRTAVRKMPNSRAAKLYGYS
ncbi:uncharacterized protein [Aegilops tauschii subsp. strangulata]|nr:uncharacterized protein LOC109766830 [Aegilops tauschii subsp. strangulata]XP_044452189.1 uncharacterized protein LOC123183439 isoform X1 [Triticum aestivum]